MSVGTDLLSLQETDLSLMRAQASLDKMPEVAELARKRASHRKLKADATRLMALRKDAQTEVADLAEERRQVEASVGAVQRSAGSSTDYQEVKRLEAELSSLAKRLDKISFSSKAAASKLEELQAKKEALARYIERFEKALLEDAKAVREKASDLIAVVDELKAQRATLRDRLPEDVLAAYDDASAKFGGLAVERLQGNKPTVCRVSLQASSMADLKHEGAVTTCPYCHRILVRDSEEE